MRYIGKDSGSGDSGCSAIAQAAAPNRETAVHVDNAAHRYQLDNTDGYLVIGVTLTDQERTQAEAAFAAEGVTVDDHEDIMWIPGRVVELAIERNTTPY